MGGDSGPASPWGRSGGPRGALDNGWAEGFSHLPADYTRGQQRGAGGGTARGPCRTLCRGAPRGQSRGKDSLGHAKVQQGSPGGWRRPQDTQKSRLVGTPERGLHGGDRGHSRRGHRRKAASQTDVPPARLFGD